MCVYAPFVCLSVLFYNLHSCGKLRGRSYFMSQSHCSFKLPIIKYSFFVPSQIAFTYSPPPHIPLRHLYISPLPCLYVREERQKINMVFLQHFWASDLSTDYFILQFVRLFFSNSIQPNLLLLGTLVLPPAIFKY